jgi:hypothetical protein
VEGRGKKGRSGPFLDPFEEKGVSARIEAETGGCAFGRTGDGEGLEVGEAERGLDLCMWGIRGGGGGE